MALSCDFSKLIPVFPLPNAVLLPRTILPLHVFEERFREMTRDALEGPRLIAMALLRPGHEKLYHTYQAPIHPIVCIGRIRREERLDDGRYNFLLQGVRRAYILSEDHDRPYRRALLAPLPVIDADPQDQCTIRRSLKVLLDRPVIRQLADCGNLADLLNCPDLSLSDVLDVLASVVLQTLDEKQAFLSEPRLCIRGASLLDALQGMAAALERRAAECRNPRTWPPVVSNN